MRLKLLELQELDIKTWKIRVRGLKNDYEEVDGVLHYQGLLFVPEAIQIEFISWYYDNFLAGYFGINKIKDFVG